LTRALTLVFWTVVALLVAWVVLNAVAHSLVEGLFGRSGARLVQTGLIGAVAACSGLLAWLEFRSNPVEEGEYGNWTGRALLYAIFFAISFFVFFPSLLNWYFAS
jgi:hypothetical protein